MFARLSILLRFMIIHMSPLLSHPDGLLLRIHRAPVALSALASFRLCLAQAD